MSKESKLRRQLEVVADAGLERERATRLLVEYDFDVDAYLRAGGELVDLPAIDAISADLPAGLQRERLERIVHFFQKVEPLYQQQRAMAGKNLTESDLRKVWNETHGPAATVTPIDAPLTSIIVGWPAKPS